MATPRFDACIRNVKTDETIPVFTGQEHPSAHRAMEVANHQLSHVNAGFYFNNPEWKVEVRETV